MLGKAVFCAIVCVFLSQACLARPEDITTLRQVETRGLRASCQDHLKQLIVSVTAVFKSVVDVALALLNGVLASLQCLVSGRLIDCQKEAFQTISNDIQSAFNLAIKGIQGIGSNAINAIKTCIGGQSTQYIEYAEPLLISFLNTYAS